MDFEWHEYRPGEKGYTTVLGPLETQIMEILWDKGTTTAREVYELLREDNPAIRRSTISIMMARLDERNLVEKEVTSGKGGLKYVYTVTIDRGSFEEEVVRTVLESLSDAFPETTKRHITSFTQERRDTDEL
jgi:predicted transcriptional regulator